MKNKILKLFIAVTVFSMVFTACGSGVLGGEKLNVKSEEIQFASNPDTQTIKAVIHTSEGDISVVMFPQYAPKAVQNFVTLAGQGFYNENTFHRVIGDFIIQSGSPDGSPSGGRSCWGLEFRDEFSDKLHHYNGALSMANHGRDTNGSQFFFVTSPIEKISDDMAAQMQDAGWRREIIDAYKQAGGMPALDYRYTVFGQITEGLDVAYKISRAETDENDRPKDDITITSIEIIPEE